MKDIGLEYLILQQNEHISKIINILDKNADEVIRLRNRVKALEEDVERLNNSD